MKGCSPSPVTSRGQWNELAPPTHWEGQSQTTGQCRRGRTDPLTRLPGRVGQTSPGGRQRTAWACAEGNQSQGAGQGPGPELDGKSPVGLGPAMQDGLNHPECSGLETVPGGVQQRAGMLPARGLEGGPSTGIRVPKTTQQGCRPLTWAEGPQYRHHPLHRLAMPTWERCAPLPPPQPLPAPLPSAFPQVCPLRRVQAGG